MPLFLQRRALIHRVSLLTLLLLLGPGAPLRAQSTRQDLGSGDPRVYDSMTPFSYRLDFPLLPPEDPMSSLSTGEPLALGILSEPQSLFDTINRSGFPTPSLTPADYNPEEVFLVGNFINERPIPAAISEPISESREIILMDYGHPVYYNMGKLARTFMFEESPVDRTLPEIPDVATSFDWQRHHLRQVGPFRMALDLYQSFATNNNVFGTATNTQSDTFFTFTPRIYFETGTRGNLGIRYAPSMVFYQKNPQLNAQNENVSLTLRYPFSKLNLGADFSYQTVSGLFIGSDGYTRQRTYLPQIFASYPLGGKTDLRATYYSVISQTDPVGEKVDHNLTINVKQTFSEKLSYGVYQELGYGTDPLGHQRYQTFGFNGNYRPNYHFRLNGNVGVHTRWLEPPAGSLGFIGTPVYDLTASYHRTSNTLLGIRVYRYVTTDTFNSVNLQLRNGVEGSFGVRFFSQTDLRLFTGLGHAKQWSSSEPKISDFTFLMGSIVISHRVSRNIEVAIFDRIERRLNSSFAENYSSNIIGLAINLQF